MLDLRTLARENCSTVAVNLRTDLTKSHWWTPLSQGEAFRFDSVLRLLKLVEVSPGPFPA